MVANSGAGLAIKYELRDYQLEWIEDIFSEWQSGNRRVLAQLPCGAGKTICFAHISRHFINRGKRVLAIAHRMELINQAASKLEDVVGVPVGIIKAGIPPFPDRAIQVASIQTLARREELPSDVGLLLFDEAHHVTASSYRRILEHYKDALILGVTATPKRIDGQGFEELFDALVVGVPTEQLIREGYLSKFRLFATNQTIATYGVRKNKKDFSSKDLALAVNSQVTAREIYQNYVQYAKNKRTIIYAASIEHSKEIAREFCRHNIKAEQVDGNTFAQERMRILQRFRQGTTSVICNYEILTEGYDYEDIECVYCIRPTESTTLWLQMVGRALRVSKSKLVATIIDLTDNCQKHGLPDDPRRWSLLASSVPYPNRGLIKCEHCTHIFRPLSLEWKVQYAEIDSDGLITRYHEARCPSCGEMVTFTTSDKEGWAHKRILVRLTPGVPGSVREIDLEVSAARIKQVYQLLQDEYLKPGQPEQIYRAIFRQFIEKILEFSLGDWRKIVRLAEPDNPMPTRKAWELYQEAALRHNNRIAALRTLEQRQSKERAQQSMQKELAIKQARSFAATELPETKVVGSPQVQQQYATQWERSLLLCTKTTAGFLSQNAGLFYVEKTPDGMNICIEIAPVENLKQWLKSIKEAEVQLAFSSGFQRSATIMFRLANSE